MNKKLVMRTLASREGWFCRYCKCRLLPIPDYVLVQELTPDGKVIPYIKKIRWNLDLMEMPKGYSAPTLDHKHPRSKGGPSDLDNFVLACKTCNKEKADGDYDSFYESKDLVRRLNKQRNKKSPGKKH